MVAIVRDRTIVIVSLLAVAGLAWIYLIGLSQGMSGMEDMLGMAMPSGPAPFALTAIMWAVMMAGMMLPTALPMILLFIVVQRRQGERPALTSMAFAAGYLLIWGGFALVAAVLQTELGKAALLSPSLAFLSTKVVGMTFLVAATYEFSPLKNRWSYAEAKALDETFAHLYAVEHGLRTVIVRPFNTVGPRQTGRYGMVVPRLIRQALAEQPLTVYGTGEQRRCFCHVHDVVHALAGDPIWRRMLPWGA